MKQLISNICRKAAFQRIVVMVFTWLVAAQSAWCNDAKPSDEHILNDAAPLENTETFKQAAIYSGYRFVTPVDNSASAAPYQRQKSGAAGGFSAGISGADLKLSTDAQFLHADDYLAELLLDYSGLYRLKLDSTAIWHNLQRLPPASATSVASIEQDSGSSPGTRTVISRANNRFKLGNNPIHLHLNYWQLTVRAQNSSVSRIMVLMRIRTVSSPAPFRSTASPVRALSGWMLTPGRSMHPIVS
jgi:hypothetical protein